MQARTTRPGLVELAKTGLFIFGWASIVAGVMVMGVVMGGGTTSVSAGIEPTDTPTPTNTATATNTPTPTNTPTSAEKTSQAVGTATAATKATETAEVVRTETAAAKATKTASNFTSTPTPNATTVPSSTSVPATTPTKTGGAAVSNLKPPNTGAGSGGANSTAWLASIGALLAVIGGGSVVAGARRRS